MKLIAHRGLVNGPNKTLENNPNHIIEILNQGFDCEIDLWMENDILYLGHDLPQYKIDQNFLFEKPLWIHAKNLKALYFLTKTKTLEYFWHQNDDFILTSTGFIWTFPGKPLTDHSICVLPELDDPELLKLNYKCYGICSDYVYKIKNLTNELL